MRCKSRSVRARGLKHKNHKLVLYAGIVALRAGAWIETGLICTKDNRADVALRAGAWIETPFARISKDSVKSRAPCGRVD